MCDWFSQTQTITRSQAVARIYLFLFIKIQQPDKNILTVNAVKQA